MDTLSIQPGIPAGALPCVVSTHGSLAAARSSGVDPAQVCDGEATSDSKNLAAEAPRDAQTLSALENMLQRRTRQLRSVTDRLRASERRLDAIFQQAAVGICQLDLSNRFILVNGRFCDLVGRRSKQLLGTSLLDVIHSDDKQRVQGLFDEMLRRRSCCTMEKRFVRPDGSVVWVYNSASVIRDDEGAPQMIVDVSQDFTALKTAEGVQRRLERQLLEAQEEERLRIARELHDQLAQHLAGMLLALESLKGNAAETTALGQIHHIQDLVEEMGREVHRVAWQLRPTALDDLGLVESLKQCADEWAERTGIPIDFHCTIPSSARFDPLIETVCFRVVQESLTNVLKHSHATSASIVISHKGGDLKIICEDNGLGFDAARVERLASESRHLGIRGIRERLALVGGELQLESSPGRGTSLFIRVPTA